MKVEDIIALKEQYPEIIDGIQFEDNALSIDEILGRIPRPPRSYFVTINFTDEFLNKKIIFPRGSDVSIMTLKSNIPTAHICTKMDSLQGVKDFFDALTILVSENN
jgi:hypothetical protein